MIGEFVLVFVRKRENKNRKSERMSACVCV